MFSILTLNESKFIVLSIFECFVEQYQYHTEFGEHKDCETSILFEAFYLFKRVLWNVKT